MTLRIDVERVRQQFPALARTHRGQQVVYLDGPGGSQVCQFAIDAVSAYMSRGGGNLHGVFPTSVETEDILAQARRSVGSLLNVPAEEVAFGPNMTTLNLAISRALARTWQPGDEIVVTELDHRANVDPWRRAAKDRGVTVKWLKVDTKTLTLDLKALDHLLSPRTRLVAVGLASNAVGTVTDVRHIASMAHAMGALVAVDAVHAAPHMVIDRDALGADMLLCSAYKFFGPHVGVATLRRDVFESLDTYKLEPAPSSIPDKLETGTQNHAGIAGVGAAISYISTLGQGATLHEKLVRAFDLIEAHEDALAWRMRQGLQDLPGVTLYSAAPDIRKTPTIAFTVDGVAPREICQEMVDEYGIFIADGDFYASTLAHKLGLDQTGGFVRAGLAPYNTNAEVDAFLEALTRVVKRRR
ncbi:cysteine desulfurase-like protein [Alicyclobacillus fastidiosus]|uniref:Cysteine desulfurase-like protein n=1 Tax=Alicyclobacillus fastidiosus TaxID=392011 RepID=A0ABY6ZIQ9_9BACL|nr:cysteine desulfurase-like protein [Alicyclobacillus fastidiosus]WAH42747.1 cysteine desulfurase-like protein [Alicyclobacillus fastidiosus]